MQSKEPSSLVRVNAYETFRIALLQCAKLDCTSLFFAIVCNMRRFHFCQNTGKKMATEIPVATKLAPSERELSCQDASTHVRLLVEQGLFSNSSTKMRGKSDRVYGGPYASRLLAI